MSKETNVAQIIENNLRNQDNYVFKELARRGRNLQLAAIQKKVLPCYNRESEIEQIRICLSRRTKPNVFLTGSSGCGKTAIVEGLAAMILQEWEKVYRKNPESAFSDVANADCPIIYELSATALMAGTRYRGDFEERIEDILSEIRMEKNVVVFLDEGHLLASMGANHEGGDSLAQLIKPALARGEIRLITATTTEEFNTLVKPDAALTRRFTEIKVDSLTGESRYSCARNIVDEFSEYWKKRYSFSVKLSDKYLRDLIDGPLGNSVFPYEFVDLLDAACAEAKFKHLKVVNEEMLSRVLAERCGVLLITE